MATRGATDGSWPLASGTWRAAGMPAAGFKLLTTALGHDCGAGLPPQDLQAFFDAGRAERFPAALYPPEFRYDPIEGQALQRQAAATAPAWVAPFGAPALSPRTASVPRGLRQYAHPLRLALRAQPGLQDDPDRELALPPHGRHELFGLRAATTAPVLLALDPDLGTLHVHLPHSGRWETLAHSHGAPLAEAGLPRAVWRCEVLGDPLGSCLFLPTQDGLACVEPDAPALRLEVRYLGEAPALGSPIAFADRVWLPLRPGDGQAVRFLGVEAQSLRTQQVEVPGVLPPALGRLHAPVSNGRWASWPGEAGQLLLRHRSDGAFQAELLPWPAGLQPVFDCGCPYLKRDATLWQLCRDAEQGRYEYVQLGRREPERHPATPPRSCSGTLSFRFAARQQRDPWLEPESGDDSTADDQLLPLLESAGGAAAVGLRWETTESLPELFAHPAHRRTQLVVDDEQGQHALLVRSLPRPWELRVFVHGGHLWAYHPELGSIPGWRLAP